MLRLPWRKQSTRTVRKTHPTTHDDTAVILCRGSPNKNHFGRQAGRQDICLLRGLWLPVRGLLWLLLLLLLWLLLLLSLWLLLLLSLWLLLLLSLLLLLGV